MTNHYELTMVKKVKKILPIEPSGRSPKAVVVELEKPSPKTMA